MYFGSGRWYESFIWMGNLAIVGLVAILLWIVVGIGWLGYWIWNHVRFV